MFRLAVTLLTLLSYGCGATPAPPPPPSRPTAQRPALPPEATALWRGRLARLEALVTRGELGARDARAASDALREDRDHLLRLYDAVPFDLVRRSADLVAALEQVRGEPDRPTDRDIFLRGARVREEAPEPETSDIHALTLEAGTLQWPLADARVTSGFGPRRDPIAGGGAFHAGLDLAAREGTPVGAAAAGAVVFAGWRDDGCGLTVVLRHGDGLATEYCHLSEVDVEAGGYVDPGTPVGRVGSTGRSTGNHLHWSVRRFGVAIDPRDLVTSGTSSRLEASVEPSE